MPKKTKNPKSKTERQKKLIKLISENLRNPKHTKTMYEMMLEAGFSDSTARQQQTIIVGIKEDLDPIVSKLEIERNRAIKALKGKINKAKYKDLTDAIDKLTKNIQLLGGKPTENIALASLSKIEADTKSLLDGLSKLKDN